MFLSKTSFAYTFENIVFKTINYILFCEWTVSVETHSSDFLFYFTVFT